MTTFAVGDIQGCFDELQQLLTQVEFDPLRDELWVVGDIVNRGPKSLETLRYLYSLGDRCKAVLGNHDLHLLAIAYGKQPPRKGDSLDSILEAPDREELLSWLRFRPLIYYDELLQVTMVHAGIPPHWSLKKALRRAKEVETILQSDNFTDFLVNMYGNQPNDWSKKLKGWDRLRIITNYFTRMRFCSSDGQLELTHKSGSNQAPAGFQPWYNHSNRKTHDDLIIFGHWAALEGKAEHENVYALDTGCIWGNALTIMNIEARTLHSLSCEGYRKNGD
ncbi:symmetrical bis(5'-nucleosyl)-tetraphosphatase [Zooshikella marina]|uniref:symmetrical bis(5'-nucleosyl)-tetraphosphatase n=1 Tax=Zooshikella ganghwensis TaxID=202772 RepID=UPI001BB090BF|nr:symmetrical bis(5'-nucleosyl)-tetraphosphatase [Zooshikella ganghwensis]MBU2708026.1 symmetrical bis(5'-nucleosyl)-tetraphosphatase [Zooshikella ganghwensis]